MFHSHGSLPEGNQWEDAQKSEFEADGCNVGMSYMDKMKCGFYIWIQHGYNMDTIWI